MKRLRQFAIFLLFLASPPAAASAGCLLTLAGPVTQQPLTYNPFQAGAATATISFTIKNTGNQTCSAAFAFFKLGALQANASGASLTYRILSIGGVPITQSAASPPEGLNTASGAALNMLPANASIMATATLSVPNSQMAGPGTYTDLLTLGVYQSLGGSSLYTKALKIAP